MKVAGATKVINWDCPCIAALEKNAIKLNSILIEAYQNSCKQKTIKSL